jgi:hypothetical protein
MADSRDGGGPWADAPSRAGAEHGLRSGEPSAFNFSSRNDNESVPQLLRDLVEQGSHLAEQQTKLVQAEVRSAAGELTTAVGAMAGAGVVAIAGLGVLLMGLSFLLAQALPLWAATLIVAVATLAIAYGMFAAGRKKIENSSLGMDRTRHTMERAPKALTGNTNHGDERDR